MDEIKEIKEYLKDDGYFARSKKNLVYAMMIHPETSEKLFDISIAFLDDGLIYLFRTFDLQKRGNKDSDIMNEFNNKFPLWKYRIDEDDNKIYMQTIIYQYDIATITWLIDNCKKTWKIMKDDQLVKVIDSDGLSDGASEEVEDCSSEYIICHHCKTKNFVNIGTSADILCSHCGELIHENKIEYAKIPNFLPSDKVYIAEDLYRQKQELHYKINSVPIADIENGDDIVARNRAKDFEHMRKIEQKYDQIVCELKLVNKEETDEMIAGFIRKYQNHGKKVFYRGDHNKFYLEGYKK